MPWIINSSCPHCGAPIYILTDEDPKTARKETINGYPAIPETQFTCNCRHNINQPTGVHIRKPSL